MKVKLLQKLLQKIESETRRDEAKNDGLALSAPVGMLVPRPICEVWGEKSTVHRF